MKYGRAINPMEATPPDCPCGAQAARAEFVRPRCHLCRVVAIEHPEYSADQVAAAGRQWWLEISLVGLRTAAAAAPGTVVSRDFYDGRSVRWVCRDDHERLGFTGSADEVTAAIETRLPNLIVSDRDEIGDESVWTLVASAPAEALR